MSQGLVGKVPIVKLLCGGMHTLVLTPGGEVFSWGCNDEGALGRGGLEDKPELVPLPIRVTDISAGNSHSIFYNTNENKSFFTGVYRVSVFELSIWISNILPLSYVEANLRKFSRKTFFPRFPIHYCHKFLFHESSQLS